MTNETEYYCENCEKLHVSNGEISFQVPEGWFFDKRTENLYCDKCKWEKFSFWYRYIFELPEKTNLYPVIVGKSKSGLTRYLKLYVIMKTKENDFLNEDRISEIKIKEIGYKYNQKYGGIYKIKGYGFSAETELIEMVNNIIGKEGYFRHRQILD